MKTNSQVILAARRTLPLAAALLLSSCTTKILPDPPELTPASNSDTDLMLAGFAKAVHLIADLNEDGEATYQEILRVDADADDEKFRAADLDNSGGLSVQEATTAITKGPAGDKLLKRFDPNGDGVINAAEQAEFDRLITATEGLRKFVEVEDLFTM